MGSMICKVYGVVDLIAAVLLIFADLPVPDFVAWILAAIFIIKGVPSLFA